jgi:hypothetical protein
MPLPLGARIETDRVNLPKQARVSAIKADTVTPRPFAMLRTCSANSAVTEVVYWAS